MGDNDKSGGNRSPRHPATGRRATGSPRPDQAIARHLAVELYRERRRAETEAESSAKPPKDPARR